MSGYGRGRTAAADARPQGTRGEERGHGHVEEERASTLRGEVQGDVHPHQHPHQHQDHHQHLHGSAHGTARPDSPSEGARRSESRARAGKRGKGTPRGTTGGTSEGEGVRGTNGAGVSSVPEEGANADDGTAARGAAAGEHGRMKVRVRAAGQDASRGAASTTAGAKAKATWTRGSREPLLEAPRRIMEEEEEEEDEEEEAPAEQFVQLLSSGTVRRWYRAHLASLPRVTLKTKAPMLDELAQVLDDATVSALDRYLRGHVASTSRDAGPLVFRRALKPALPWTLDLAFDPFLLLLVLPHTEWPVGLRGLADTA